MSFIHETMKVYTQTEQNIVKSHFTAQKSSFPFKISSVNGKLHVLRSV